MTDGIEVGAVYVDILPSTRRLATELKAKTRDLSIEVSVAANTKRAEADIDKMTRDRKVNVDVNTRGGRGLSAMTQSIIGLAPLIGPLAAGAGALGAALAVPVGAAVGGLTLGGILTGATVKETNKQLKQVDQLRKKADAARQALANTQASVATSVQNQMAAAQRSAANSLASAQRSNVNANAAAVRSAQQSLANAQRALGVAKTPGARTAAQLRVEQAQQTLANRQAASSASLSARQQATAASLQARQANISASAQARQAAAQRKSAEATKAYQTALDGLTPAQQRYATSKGNLKEAFQGLLNRDGSSILGPVNKSLDLLSTTLPKLDPLIKPVSRSIGTLLDDVNRYASSKGFDKFIKGFGSQSSSAILHYGRDAENLISGTVGLLGQFGPLANDFDGWLTRITRRYKEFGQNAGGNPKVQEFVSYLRQEGPKVADAIGAIAGATGHLVSALAPIGGVELQGITDLANAIDKIPIGILRAVAGEGAIALVAFKGYKTFQAASGALDSLSGSLGKLSVNGTKGGALGKGQTAVRAFAGAAGLGLITAGVSTANKSLGTLETVGGGALTGFGVAGPIGAAVGAGAGLIASLGLNAIKSGQQAKVSLGNWKDYAATLDDVSGATTSLTRKMALQRLQATPGAIKTASSAGLTNRDVVDAVVNGGQSSKFVRNRLEAQRALEQANLDTKIAAITAQEQKNLRQGVRGAASVASGEISKAKSETRARLANIDALEAELGAVGKSIKAKRQDINATKEYGSALYKLPKGVSTKVEAKGLNLSLADVKDLRKQYHLTDRQVTTVIRQSGADVTLAAVKKLNREADRAARPRTLNITAVLGKVAGNLTVAGGNDLAKPTPHGRVATVGRSGGGTTEVVGTLQLSDKGAYIKGQAQQVVSSTDAHKAVQRRAQQAGQARPQ